MPAPSPSTTLLEDQLCFALYSASRALTAALRPGLAELGLTYTQYVVMLVLWERGTVPLSRLCHQLHLDSATLSPLLKRLAAQGLVTRSRREDDERQVDVACTDAGLALQDGVRAVQLDVERATGLSRDEQTLLRDQLHELADRVRQQVDAGVR